MARGVPPPWISTIFGAEAWAVLQAVAHADRRAALRIDCKPVVGLLIAGPDRAVTHKRLTAAVWSDIFKALGGVPPADVSWMPAHTSLADVGQRVLGNGTVLTEIDRRGNAAADLQAKAAVEEHRVPEAVRSRIAQQEKEVEQMARWVALATMEANSWGDAKLRDSESAPRKKRCPSNRGRHRRRAKPEISPDLGGHDFKPTEGRIRRTWQCALCHCTTNRPARLTHQHCCGSAVRRWAAQTAALAGRTSGVGAGHVLLLTGTVVWCFHCGASASVRAHNLRKPCPRRTHGYLVQSRQRLLLGLHPDTRVPLRGLTVPEPGRSLPLGFAAAQEAAACSGTRPASSPLAAEHPRLAAVRARVRARAAAAAAVA